MKRKKDKPTDRQMEVLTFISERIEAKEPPSVQDIQEAFGWESKNAAATHIDYLEEKNLIVRSGKSRSIRITERGLDVLKADQEYNWMSERKVHVPVVQQDKDWYVHIDKLDDYFASSRMLKLYKFCLLMQNGEEQDINEFPVRMFRMAMKDALLQEEDKS